MPYSCGMPNDEDLITVAEAAQLFNVDVRTVHRWIKRGDLTGRKAYDGLRAPYLLHRRNVERLAAKRVAA